MDEKYISNSKKSEWKAEIKNKMVNYLEKSDQNKKRHKTRFPRNDNWTKKSHRIRSRRGLLYNKFKIKYDKH